MSQPAPQWLTELFQEHEWRHYWRSPLMFSISLFTNYMVTSFHFTVFRWSHTPFLFLICNLQFRFNLQIHRCSPQNLSESPNFSLSRKYLPQVRNLYPHTRFQMAILKKIIFAISFFILTKQPTLVSLI
jgi:hypothetical protein